MRSSETVIWIQVRVSIFRLETIKKEHEFQRFKHHLYCTNMLNLPQILNNAHDTVKVKKDPMKIHLWAVPFDQHLWAVWVLYVLHTKFTLFYFWEKFRIQMYQPNAFTGSWGW